MVEWKSTDILWNLLCYVYYVLAIQHARKQMKHDFVSVCSKACPKLFGQISQAFVRSTWRRWWKCYVEKFCFNCLIFLSVHAPTICSPGQLLLLSLFSSAENYDVTIGWWTVSWWSCFSFFVLMHGSSRAWSISMYKYELLVLKIMDLRSYFCNYF